MKLGTSWSLHENYVELFSSSALLQNQLCEYFTVLIKLCCKIVLFSQKSHAAQLFSSLGASFDAEFGVTQKDMEGRGQIIQRIAEQLAAKSFLGSERSRVNDKKWRIIHKLSPGQAQYDTT